MIKIDVNKAILESKKIIMNDLETKIMEPVQFFNYSKCYFSTTENIKAYLKQINYNKDDILTILGSGDHDFKMLLS